MKKKILSVFLVLSIILPIWVIPVHAGSGYDYLLQMFDDNSDGNLSLEESSFNNTVVWIDGNNYRYVDEFGMEISGSRDPGFLAEILNCIHATGCSIIINGCTVDEGAMNAILSDIENKLNYGGEQNEYYIGVGGWHGDIDSPWNTYGDIIINDGGINSMNVSWAMYEYNNPDYYYSNENIAKRIVATQGHNITNIKALYIDNANGWNDGSSIGILSYFAIPHFNIMNTLLGNTDLSKIDFTDFANSIIETEFNFGGDAGPEIGALISKLTKTEKIYDICPKYVQYLPSGVKELSLNKYGYYWYGYENENPYEFVSTKPFANLSNLKKLDIGNYFGNIVPENFDMSNLVNLEEFACFSGLPAGTILPNAPNMSSVTITGGVAANVDFSPFKSVSSLNINTDYNTANGVDGIDLSS